MTGQPAAEARPSLPLQTSLVLGALPSVVACARLHARNVMCEWDLPSVADSVELVVSELVTNAVRASTGCCGGDLSRPTRPPPPSEAPYPPHAPHPPPP